MRRGRLDAEAVDAVVGAAGHPVPRRREGPAGLTRREVDVEQIHGKVGASTRAAAALFAMQQGLLPEEARAASDAGG